MKAKQLLTALLLVAATRGHAQNKDLDFFVQQAIRSSPLLKDYGLQEFSNKIDSQRLKASFLPQVTGNGAAYYAPVIAGFGYDGTITNVHTLNAQLTATKKFIGKENLKNQYGAFQLANLGLQNQGRITEQELKRSVTQQYITVYGDMQQLAFNEELLSLLRSEDSLLKRLTYKSVFKQTDYLSFLVTVQQQDLLVEQTRMQSTNDMATLNYLAGITDTTLSTLTPPAMPGTDLLVLGQTVFYNQYIIDSLKLVNADRQIDYDYKPKLNAFGDGGYNSSFLDVPYKNFGVSAGISLVIPIYDGRQRTMLHQKNKIAEETRKNYLGFYASQYNQQIAQLNQQLVQTDRMIVRAQEQLKYVEALIQAQRKQLVTGDVRITDYIIAIGNYLTAKNIVTQNMTGRLQIINQIEYWNRKK